MSIKIDINTHTYILRWQCVIGTNTDDDPKKENREFKTYHLCIVKNFVCIIL